MRDSEMMDDRPMADTRLLILGATGMLGHKLLQVCSKRFSCFATIRGEQVATLPAQLFESSRIIGGVTATDWASILRAFAQIQPTVVVNCIGIVKQQRGAYDPLLSIGVNATFPQRLALLCQAIGARLIHLSTDCVFSGSRGGYTESDNPDPVDLYGRTKLLGEVAGDALTLRTSIIGRELATTQGLLEWFLTCRGGGAQGYRKAIFSGLTTQALAETIARIIQHHPDLRGVLHVAADPIAKFDLLDLVRVEMNLDIELLPNDQVIIDRSLNGSQFAELTGWTAPTWPAMIAALAADVTPYDDIRGKYAHE